MASESEFNCFSVKNMNGGKKKKKMIVRLTVAGPSVTEGCICVCMIGMIQAEPASLLTALFC